MTNQSLPYVNANSTSSIRARSVGPASTDPKSTCASSNSQKRGVGIPRKLTGAGIAVLATCSKALSDTPPSFSFGSTSKAYQSRLPSKYSCAVKARSPSVKRAETEKAYSIRSESHDGFAASGSLKNAAEDFSQTSAACCISIVSPGATFNPGAIKILFGPPERNEAAMRRASGTRDIIKSTKLELSLS